ncbi:MAG TPA: CDP-2,3-bis-(O-geranylgeranyl)-sn-glycerol synthase [archaeon]|jgi:CDP-2,3-bis-(O-geranylgeranyl)-sn-glycerol synthase|nr:CDP-2,3-bis-(O-geranylgeranyl)-sn-glycerol synthase [archaeon]
MVFDIYTLVEAIWLILPAYAANGLTPIIGLRKGLHPIDGGRRLKGEPLFGPGKTWEGLVFGTLVGGLIGLIEMLVYPYLPFSVSPVPLDIIPMSILLGLLLGFGAMFGDLGGSFIKRRLKIQRGKPAPILDQEDFLVGALLFSLLLVSLKWDWVILLAVITPVIHIVANGIGYLIKVKKQPW